MDVARTCTDRDCQFFRDGGPVATIHWYRCAPDALNFPVAHKIPHLAWFTQPWTAEGVGEVYGSKETYNNGFTPPTSRGIDFYGPLEYFQLGAPFDPSVNVDRDPWGLATDCTADLLWGLGGEAIGGETNVTHCGCKTEAAVLFAHFTAIGGSCPDLDGLTVPMFIPGFPCVALGAPQDQIACSDEIMVGTIPCRVAMWCDGFLHTRNRLSFVTPTGGSTIATARAPLSATCVPFDWYTETVGGQFSIFCPLSQVAIHVTQ